MSCTAYPDATPPTTFVDRLRAISLGALLRARLDGDRWAELALADLLDLATRCAKSFVKLNGLPGPPSLGHS